MAAAGTSCETHGWPPHRGTKQLCCHQRATSSANYPCSHPALLRPSLPLQAFVVVGDFNGHVGLGVKCAKEVATAIRGGCPALAQRGI